MTTTSSNLRSVLTASLAGLILLALFISSCANNKPTDPSGGAGGIDTLAVTTAVSQAAPVAFVELSGIPAGKTNLYGTVTSIPAPARGELNSLSGAGPAATDSCLAVVFESDGKYYLVSPLNPADPLAGGDVAIVISDDGTFVTEPITFTVDPLPEAPGEFDAIVGLLQSLLDHQLRVVGYSRDSLDAVSIAYAPVQLFPLLVAYDAIDSPDNPNSLRAYANGTAPILLEGPTHDDLLDRILALTGYREYLEDYVGGLDTVSALSLSGRYDDFSSARAVHTSGASSICLPAPDLGIATCADLAAAMIKHSQLAATAGSAAEKVKADIAGAALAAIGLLPGGAVPATAAGSILFVDAKIAEGQMGLYPSEFVDGATSWDPSKSEFKEDFIEPGEWTSFLVTATSTGWILDQLIVDAIMQGLSAKGAAQSVNQTSPAVGDAFDQLGANVGGMVKGKGQKFLIDEVYGSNDIIEICPNTWSNIDCVGETNSKVTVSSGSLDVNESAQTYEPTDIGFATFRIETNASFGAQTTGTAATVDTRAIEIFLDPFQAEADTSETIAFHVRVENAIDKRVNYTLENGGSLSNATSESVDVTTPGNDWNPPLRLVATSLSSSGLRATNPDAREDDALITYNGAGAAFLTPNAVCVKPGNTARFEVTYTGGTINSVSWELDPPGTGTLNGDLTGATYTAPGQNVGEVTISARVNDTSTATATVDVSSCVCHWVFQAGGAQAYYATGTWSTASDLGALVVYLNETELTSLPLFAFAAYNAFDTGSYQTDAISFTGTDEITWAVSDLSQALPTIVITSYEFGQYVEGSAHGVLSNMTNLNPPEYDYITFTVTFRAEFFNLDRPQCVDD